MKVFVAITNILTMFACGVVVYYSWKTRKLLKEVGLTALPVVYALGIALWLWKSKSAWTTLLTKNHMIIKYVRWKLQSD